MKNIFISILFFTALTLHSQNKFTLGGQIGYSKNSGPVEKYSGSFVDGYLRYEHKQFFLKINYAHITGRPNYGKYYSKDLPNVPVHDKYVENYGLLEFPPNDSIHIRAGIHQFDPDYAKYIARQLSLGLGYKVIWKVKGINFNFLPSVDFLYRGINENFVYGVREIEVENSFLSREYTTVNYLIFAYLRYDNLGYSMSLPVEIPISKYSNVNFTYTTGKQYRYGFNNFSIGLNAIL